ncbi:MAG: PmeII family type II restriction endonuclease [Anaerolineales bacterium]|nr:PmeII family type II restriction endonuclease [Anaerolineales bacterium]
MKALSLNEVTEFVEANIGDFHHRRAENIQRLHLSTILKRKNPYLFRAKNISTAQDLVKGLLDAHLSSQEEAIFGEFLESLAIYVCNKVFNGRKSAAEGIDLEFERDQTLYIVSIKSGPNWGNSSQVKRMVENFKKAKRILQTSGWKQNIQAVNGCCYGVDRQPNKGDYWKLCGQSFWEFISGNERLYLEIIEPLGHRAKEHNEEFLENYSRTINVFTQQFIENFCEDGRINWERLVQFNSSKHLSLLEDH